MSDLTEKHWHTCVQRTERSKVSEREETLRRRYSLVAFILRGASPKDRITKAMVTSLSNQLYNLKTALKWKFSLG